MPADKKNQQSSGFGKFLLITFGIMSIFLVYLLLSAKKQSNPTANTPQTNSTEISGVQYLDLTAKGGYSPSTLTAKADQPTVLRVKTSNTFDCSSAIVIPSLGYRNNLPSTGSTEISIPAQKKGTEIKGSCAMGMYRFSINFI